MTKDVAQNIFKTDALHNSHSDFFNRVYWHVKIKMLRMHAEEEKVDCMNAYINELHIE